MTAFRSAFVARAVVLVMIGLSALGDAAAQSDAHPPSGGVPAINAIAPLSPAPSAAPIKQGTLRLSALLTSRDTQPISKAPIHWRVFDEKVDVQGRHAMVASSTDAAPTFTLPQATYLVHVALGLSSAVRRVTVADEPSSERLVLNAGALRIVGMLGEKPVNPANLSVAVYVPQAGNSEAKLIIPAAKAGDLIALPEGNYHVVSTLLDTSGYAAKSGVGNKTNSVVSADLKVQAGKLTDATLRHRSAVMTMKLVTEPGGDAMANTAFTILTPGGDVIRELIGAFPSVVLAEGEYVVIARQGAKTYPLKFNVTSTQDRDVEVVAK